MLYHHGFALGLAQERDRELERIAAQHRLLAELRGDVERERPHRIMALAVRPLRAFSSATHAIADAACSAAARLEGGAA